MTLTMSLTHLVSLGQHPTGHPNKRGIEEALTWCSGCVWHSPLQNLTHSIFTPVVGQDTPVLGSCVVITPLYRIGKLTNCKA